MTMKRTPILLAALAAPLLLAGCISFGAKPPPTLLSLTADATLPAGTTRSGLPSEAVVVLTPEVTRKLATNRVPVQVDDSNIAYLKDAQWVDMPARLMRSLLASTIAANGSRMVLQEADTNGKATFFLSGELSEFGYDAATKETVVVYDAVKIRNGQPVEQRRFEAREPLATAEAGPVGAALNRGANKVAAEVAAWVG